MASCGKQSREDQSPPASTPSKSTEPNVSTSYYVNSEAELITCDASRHGYLVYVKSISQFEACLEGGWSVVDVRGKDGVQGQAGTSGKNGTMVSGNEWYDAITDKMWVMSTLSTSTVGWSNSQSACGGAYRMPTPNEIMAALTHGMKACAQALASPPTQIIANDGQTYNVSNGALNNTGSGAQFCIAQ